MGKRGREGGGGRLPCQRTAPAAGLPAAAVRSEAPSLARPHRRPFRPHECARRHGVLPPPAGSPKTGWGSAPPASLSVRAGPGRPPPPPPPARPPRTRAHGTPVRLAAIDTPSACSWLAPPSAVPCATSAPTTAPRAGDALPGPPRPLGKVPHTERRGLAVAEGGREEGGEPSRALPLRASCRPAGSRWGYGHRRQALWPGGGPVAGTPTQVGSVPQPASAVQAPPSAAQRTALWVAARTRAWPPL